MNSEMFLQSSQMHVVKMNIFTSQPNPGFEPGTSALGVLRATIAPVSPCICADVMSKIVVQYPLCIEIQFGLEILL